MLSKTWKVNIREVKLEKSYWEW